jgi:hypothetical protein
MNWKILTMIQTTRALGFGVFLLFVFGAHKFYNSAPAGTGFGFCPAPEIHNSEATAGNVCPASCSGKGSEFEKLLAVQRLCSDICKLEKEGYPKGVFEEDDTGEEQVGDEENQDTPIGTEQNIVGVEATGGPSKYSLGVLGGNLRDVMNETLGVSDI